MSYRIIERDGKYPMYVVQTDQNQIGHWQQNIIPYHNGIYPQSPWRDLASFDTLEKARKFLTRSKDFLNENERIVT